MPTNNSCDFQILPISSGGTNASSMATADGVVYYDGTRLVTTSAGTANYVLTSNGAGSAPTFQAAIGGSAFTEVAMQIFSSNGTYTPTAGMKYCVIEVYGGGGAGGGAAATGAGEYSVGGGGGAGGYSRGVFSAATIGVSQSVTVPAAATGVSGAGGNTGGTCKIGSTLIQATGGTGGSASSAGASSFGAAGVGGVGSLGSVNAYGAQGGMGWCTNISNAGNWNGQGANSPVGQGGAQSLNSAHNTGGAGRGFASGGAGATNTASQSALSGASGAVGLVIVTEFI